MSTSVLTTVSPSSSSKTRSTPCVDGCCGPMLRTIVFAGPVAVWTIVMAMIHLSYFRRAPSRSRTRKSARALHGIILAKGVAFPVFGQEHAPQIGMPFKAHAKQIKYLALVPICRRPNRHDTLNHRRLPRQADAQTQRIAPRNRKKVVI